MFIIINIFIKIIDYKLGKIIFNISSFIKVIFNIII